MPGNSERFFQVRRVTAFETCLIYRLKSIQAKTEIIKYLWTICKQSLSSSHESSMNLVSSSGMGGRVVDCARLESVYTERYRGFESLPIRQKFAQRILITTLGDETEVRAPQRHRLRHAQPRRGVGQRPKSIPPHPPEIRAANSNKRAGARAIDHPCDEPKWPSRWGRRESTLQSSSVAETISFQHSGSSQFRKPLQPWINFKMTNPRSFAFPSISESPSDPNRSSLLE